VVAVVYEEKVSRVKVFKCDKCGDTTPASLAGAMRVADPLIGTWLLMEKERVLCPACARSILEAWYNQQEVGNFQLHGSVGEPMGNKKHSRVVA
jgi:hypothetical protein